MKTLGLLLILLLAGCSYQQQVIDTWVVMDGKRHLISHDIISTTKVLYFSKTTDLHVKRKDIEVNVGSLEQKPDPDTIKAIIEGVIAGIKSGL